MASSHSARDSLFENLRRQLERLEGCRPPEDERPISTGSPDLDRLLPSGGLRRGTLVEYLTPSAGGGAGTLALAAAREACGEGRALVVVEERRGRGGERERGREAFFYPPVAVALGIDLSLMLVVRVASEADAVWALDQGLRCPGVGAVWSRLPRIDVRDFRRLQLAAECGGTLGLFIRPARCRGQPSWAEVQFQVSSSTLQVSRSKSSRFQSKLRVGGFSGSKFWLSAWRLEVELVRCRGAAGGQKVLLELDEAAGMWREVCDEAADRVRVLAGMGDSTSRPRRA